MNEDAPKNTASTDRSRPAASDKPQPWHEADEKRASPGGAPIGTHSLTGGGAGVGMPAKPSSNAGAERGNRPSDVDAPAEPDPLAEPRANVGEILGRKP
jgi:hypothetical protein